MFIAISLLPRTSLDSDATPTVTRSEAGSVYAVRDGCGERLCARRRPTGARSSRSSPRYSLHGAVPADRPDRAEPAACTRKVRDRRAVLTKAQLSGARSPYSPDWELIRPCIEKNVRLLAVPVDRLLAVDGTRRPTHRVYRRV